MEHGEYALPIGSAVAVLSFGKMSTPIDIVQTTKTKDADGFGTSTDVVLTTVRAYKEDRYGSKIWANRAAFSTATCLFRFRVIPGLDVTTKLAIICDGARYRILSAEDVRGRGVRP